jgi:hypothetical protein
MRLSDAGLRRHQTKLIYLNHRSPSWLTEDTPRDRSNRLLEVNGMNSHCRLIAFDTENTEITRHFKLPGRNLNE